MSAPIHFKGTNYDSVAAMPPHIRHAYEQSQRDKDRHQPSQDDEDEEADEEDDDKGDDKSDLQPKPAWSGALPGSDVLVASGILDSQAYQDNAALSEQGLEVAGHAHIEDGVALIARKDAG